MIIRGNTVGAPSPRADYAQTDPTAADYIKNKPDEAIRRAQETADLAQAAANAKMTLVVGGTEPTTGPALWFNTSAATQKAAPLLELDEEESGYPVQSEVDGETYGVKNAKVNESAVAGTYDFTIY